MNNGLKLFAVSYIVAYGTLPLGIGLWLTIGFWYGLAVWFVGMIVGLVGGGLGLTLARRHDTKTSNRSRR